MIIYTHTDLRGWVPWLLFTHRLKGWVLWLLFTHRLKGWVPWLLFTHRLAWLSFLMIIYTQACGVEFVDYLLTGLSSLTMLPYGPFSTLSTTSHTRSSNLFSKSSKEMKGHSASMWVYLVTEKLTLQVWTGVNQQKMSIGLVGEFFWKVPSFFFLISLCILFWNFDAKFKMAKRNKQCWLSLSNSYSARCLLVRECSARYDWAILKTSPMEGIHVSR